MKINSSNKRYIKLEEVKLSLDEKESLLDEKIISILEINPEELIGYKISKKAVDSRNKNKIFFVYSLEVEINNHEAFLEKIENPTNSLRQSIAQHKLRECEPYVYRINKLTSSSRQRPLIIGAGPAGLFCALVLAEAGLKPIIIERGGDILSRVEDVDNFFKTGELNLNSNVQFGEGGAGTFSDGKLYTLINDPRSKYVFDELLAAGAPDNIAWDANPHIGTDKLRGVVINIRKKIERLGGEIRFNTCMTDIKVENDEISSIEIDKKDFIEVKELVIALGHSARDTFEVLYQRGLLMAAKPFSMGLRIEHKAEMINKVQYGKYFNHSKLPTARYKLVAHLPLKRSVYTFCMCPGGYVVAASSEKNRLVVNGMSEYAQDSENSNSALLVSVFPEDFGKDHPLAGIQFQRKWEEKAYLFGGGNFRAPVQLVGDFLKAKTTKEIKSIKPSYRPGFCMANLDECLPEYITDSIREALPLLDNKIKGFAHPDAILSGIESRSSSPVKIIRNEKFESNIKGIYPAGEGAGYAGGITSSAIDGMKVAEALLDKYII